jgi:3-methyladenine DNA glycosylase/8-oxoguanine DNA glycosylase
METVHTESILLGSDDRAVLADIVHSHGWWQLLPFEWDVDAGVLHCTQQSDDQVVDLSLWQADELSVHMQVQSCAALSLVGLHAIQARGRWMLALDEDLQGFYHLCRSEPRLEHVPAERKGRLLRSFSLFEDVVKVICTTNTTWAQTQGMVQRLVERLGRPSPVSGSRAFPSPQAIVAAGEAVLREEVRLGYRAPYIFDLARRVSDGELDLEAWRTSPASTGELRKQLLQIKGVGPYAAASLLMLLGRYDYIGVDSWARKLVSRQFYQGQPVRESEIQAAFERYGAWRALAYWFYRYDDST